MKKYILTISLAVSALFAAAQSDTTKLVSKKGIPILPAEGDYAIGVDATPLLKYVGGFLSNAGGGDLSDFKKTTLYGKYYLSDNSAIRVCVLFGKTSKTTGNYSQNDVSFAKDPLTNDKVTDFATTYQNNYGIDLAYQKNRGYGRLRGIYGAQIGFAYNSTNSEYQYGNPLSADNLKPSSTMPGATIIEGKRQLSTEGGARKAFSMGALAGVEYFFAPKMCIGFELNLALVYLVTNQTYNTFEYYNGSSVQKINELGTPTKTDFGLQTGYPTSTGGQLDGANSTVSNVVRPGGSIYLMFHF